MYFADLYSAIRRAAAGSVLAVAVVDEVERLPDAELDAELVEDVEHRGRGAAHERVGVDEREVADEDRHPFTEAARLAAPACVDVATGEVPVHRVAIAAGVGAVHHVVVDERERVHELERGRGVDHRGRVGAAAADERAVAERGPQALAARADEQPQLVERFDQRGLDRGPARDLGVEEPEDPRFDLVGDAHERGGERRFAPIHVRRLSTTSAGQSPRSGRRWIVSGRARVPERRVARGVGRVGPGDGPVPGTSPRSCSNRSSPTTGRDGRALPARVHGGRAARAPR